MVNSGVIRVHILAAVFGIGSWVCILGLFVELPLLVQSLPEGWTLPSYLSVVVLLSNVGPLAYFISHRIFPKSVTERGGIYVILIIGAAATLSLSFCWRATSFVFGANRSTGLLGLTFLMGMVDCSSRVLYPPFMARFHPTYLVSYYLGEGLSGLIPSLLALAQGVGGDQECRPKFTSGSNSTTFELYSEPPSFSVEAYFCSLLGMFLLSGIAFQLLQCKCIVKDALAHFEGPEKVVTSSKPSSGLPGLRSVDGVSQGPMDGTEVKIQISQIESDPEIGLLLGILALTTFVFYGVLPSIQSFSCMPYGSLTYSLALTLANIANPVLCAVLLVPRIPRTTLRTIGWATGIGIIFSAYAIVTALMSPSPPLVGTIPGEIVLILTWVSLNCCFTYGRVGVSTLISESNGKEGLLLYGLVNQGGVIVGSLGTFLIINLTHVFQSYSKPCP